MKTMQITRYICSDCGKVYDTAKDAQDCHTYHQKQMPLPHVPYTHIEYKYWPKLLGTQQ